MSDVLIVGIVCIVVSFVVGFLFGDLWSCGKTCLFHPKAEKVSRP